MANGFLPAPQVAEVAEGLIEQYHSHLIRHQARIEYLFTTKTPMKGGMATWGTVRRIGSLAAFLAGEEESMEEGNTNPFFVICISEPIWNVISDQQKKALVDHELSHLGAEYDKNGVTRLFIVPHDLEEFHSIYGRHGAWRESIKQFMKAREVYERDCANGQTTMATDWNDGKGGNLPTMISTPGGLYILGVDEADIVVDAPALLGASVTEMETEEAA